MHVVQPCANDGCDWKHSAWSEDVFAQRCMGYHYVGKVAAFDMTADVAHLTDRPMDQKTKQDVACGGLIAGGYGDIYPHKKPGEYFKCLSCVVIVP